MTTATVSRLRLRGPPGLQGQAVQQISDAIRLAPGGSERLLLLQKLDLGRQGLGGSPTALAESTAQRLRLASAAAVHGGARGVGDATAVWFHNIGEARGLLLLRLASSIRSTAWFWRLAVPDWQGRNLTDWLPELFAQARRDPGAEVALARAIGRIAEAGRLPELVGAMAQSMLPAPDFAGRPHPVLATSSNHAPPRADAPAPIETIAELKRLLSPLPTMLRTAFDTAFATLPPSTSAALWLARTVLLISRPTLAGQREMLAGLAEMLMVPDVANTVLRINHAAPTPPTPDRARTPGSAANLAQPAPQPTNVTTNPEDTTPGPPDATQGAAAPTPTGEQRSDAAGLFLVINALERLDFPAWLNRHPALEVDGFATGLLRHLGERMRIPEGDPLFACLDAPTPQPPWAAALTLWRVGLDRWLRRRAGLRLAEIIGRSGWLTWTDERIDIRFPLAAADIRLRRHALDIDPGWTPWFGRVVVYHFSDEARP